jgi:ribosomal protein L7/L12
MKSFPETEEEILVWALENAGNKKSIVIIEYEKIMGSGLVSAHKMDLVDSMRLFYRKWVAKIEFEFPNIKVIRSPSSHSHIYRISVAGVQVF